MWAPDPRGGGLQAIQRQIFLSWLLRARKKKAIPATKPFSGEIKWKVQLITGALFAALSVLLDCGMTQTTSRA